MKRVIYITLGIILLWNCEDVVNVDIPEGTPRLIVDASFEFYPDEVPIGIDTFVRLSESAPFFNEEIPPVSGATVFVTNLNDNSVVEFLEGNNGIYSPNCFPCLVPNDFETEYELTVLHNGETYKATNKLFPAVPIDNIEQGDGILFDENNTEVIVTFTDEAPRDDFYLFDFDFSLLEVSEDRFYQGQQFSFSYFYEDMVVGQDVTIRILGISEAYHDYLEQIIELSDQDSGGPFQVQPSVTRGNIVNITNPDNFALGYFNLSEVYDFNFTIQEE